MTMMWTRLNEIIVYIDEIDKISGNQIIRLTRDMCQVKVFSEALLQGKSRSTVASVHFKRPGEASSQEFCGSLSNILFVCGGAFANHEKLYEIDLPKGGIGFSAEVTSKDSQKSIGETLLEVEPEDLIGYGLITEFIGECTIVATLQELDEDALMSILVEPKNALTKQYRNMFEMENVDGLRQDALQAITKKEAIERKTGARDCTIL